MGRESKWSFKYPPGAVKTRDELRDLIIEARKEKKAIRLYAVGQMGHLRVYYLTSTSQLQKPKYKTGLCSGDSFYSTAAYVDHSCIGHNKTNNRWFKDQILCGSYSIGTMSSEHHRLFTNKMHAENYATELKNDAEYVKSVHEHWEWCSRMDEVFGI